MSKKGYVIDKRFPGIRKRSLGIVEGFGEDWTFFINCRDKSQQGKVIHLRLGKASEGWTMKKAFLKKEEILASNQPLEEKSKETITLKDIFMDYSRYNAMEKPRAIKEYKGYCKRITFFDSLPVKDIRNRTVQDLRRKLEQYRTAKGAPYAPKTICAILKTIRMLINYGVKRELCDPRPDLIIESPRVDNNKLETVTKEQLAAYMKALSEDRDRVGVAFLKMALFTGMRPKAIMNLKWSDIDYENQAIKLRGEIAKNKTTSYIPLPENFEEIIAEIPRTEYSEYLFEQSNGRPRHTFNKTALRIRDKAGLPKDYRPVYMLRHIFASLIISNGASLYTVQHMLTHSSPAMTQRYAHLADEPMREASKIMVNVVNEAIKSA